jgi:hypothetical protein
MCPFLINKFTLQHYATASFSDFDRYTHVSLIIILKEFSPRHPKNTDYISTYVSNDREVFVKAYPRPIPKAWPRPNKPKQVSRMLAMPNQTSPRLPISTQAYPRPTYA